MDERGIEPFRLSAPRLRILVATLMLVGVGIVFLWWGMEQGGYFGAQFYPGAIGVFALFAVLILAAPFQFGLSGPARVALIALGVLGLLTLLSLFWTPNRDAAITYAERTLLYAAFFGVGLLVSRLLAERSMLALVPVGVAIAIAGAYTVITVWGGSDVTAYVHGDATLRFPIGYRNADATFFLIGVWVLLVLAASDFGHWAFRALAIGAVTMLLELAIVAQSRGSLPAAAVALVVFFLVSGNRLRATACLAVAALPILPALPTLLDPFQHGDANQALLPILDSAMRAILLSTLVSIALGALALRVIGPMLRLSPTVRTRLGVGLATVAIGTASVAGVVFLAERGGPINFLDQKVSEFRFAGNPDLSAQGTRFGLNVGSGRSDYFRVALDEGADHPLLGGGAGAFQITYLEDRDSLESPRDPHSIELLMWSELGLAGVALLATFVVAAVIAALRSRRVGPAAAALATAALAAGADWLVHGSYDWFWYYPALTAPVIYMLGVAAGPGLRQGTELGRVARYSLASLAAAALVLAIPLFLSERYAERAYDEWRVDRAAAYSDLDRASSLNPYDDRALLAKGLIAGRTEDPGTAVEAFREAIDRQPDNYAGHFFLARQLAGSSRAEAQEQIGIAHRLNPRDLTVNGLRRELFAEQR